MRSRIPARVEIVIDPSDLSHETNSGDPELWDQVAEDLDYIEHKFAASVKDDYEMKVTEVLSTDSFDIVNQAQEKFLGPLCGRKLGSSRGLPIKRMSKDEEALYDVLEVMEE